MTSASGFLSNRLLALLAAGIIFASLCFRLGYLPLLAPDEGRNAEVGREMKESGAWLVPTYNGVDYLDKPAFYFKAVAFSLALFGKNETGARMPSVAFGIALLVLIFLFCRKVYNPRCGLLAVMITATMPLFLVNARTVIFDTPLAFFVSGAIFAGYLAETTEGKERRNWYLAGAVAAGFATLVKGPVGFLIPALVLMVFNGIEGRRRAWLRMLAPLNVAVFLVITLPWFVGLCRAHPDFLQYGLVEESFKRFTTAKRFRRSEPIYFYLLIVAVMFLPWSLLLPEASLATWRWAKKEADRLCLVWALVVIVFFSLSQSKLPGYIVSVTVACGLLLARLFGAAMAEPQGKAARIVNHGAMAFAAMCLLGAVAVVAGAWRWPTLVRLLRIPGTDAEKLAHAIIPLAAVLLGFGLFAVLASYRRNASLCFLCMALFPPICIHANAAALEVVFEAKSGRRLACQLAKLEPSTELACLECFPNGLSFYLGRKITVFSKDGGELTSNYIISALKKSERRPPQLLRLADLESWLLSRQTPVYLIIHQEARSTLEAIALPHGAKVEVLSPRYCGAKLPALGKH